MADTNNKKGSDKLKHAKRGNRFVFKGNVPILTKKIIVKKENGNICREQFNFYLKKNNG